MDGIFLKFIKTTCREIANYPKYILKTPKEIQERTFQMSLLEQLQKSFDKLLDYLTIMGFIRTLSVCTFKEKEYPV